MNTETRVTTVYYGGPLDGDNVSAARVVNVEPDKMVGREIKLESLFVTKNGAAMHALYRITKYDVGRSVVLYRADFVGYR